MADEIKVSTDSGSGGETEKTVDHAEKIGAAVTRLDALDAAKETLETTVSGIKDSVDFMRSQFESFSSSQYEVANRLEKLEAEKAIAKEVSVVEEPVKPAEGAVTSAEQVAEKTVESVTPPIEVSPDNKKSEGPLSWFHRLLG